MVSREGQLGKLFAFAVGVGEIHIAIPTKSFKTKEFLPHYLKDCTRDDNLRLQFSALCRSCICKIGSAALVCGVRCSQRINSIQVLVDDAIHLFEVGNSILHILSRDNKLPDNPILRF